MSCADALTLWQWIYAGLMSVSIGFVGYCTFRVAQRSRALKAKHFELMREIEAEIASLKQAPVDWLERMVAEDRKRRIVH